MQTMLSSKTTKILIATKYFGETIRISRKRLGLSTKDAAKSLGISHHRLQKYENGNLIIPRDILIKLFSNGIKSFDK